MFYKLKVKTTVNYFNRTTEEMGTRTKTNNQTNGAIINLDKIIYIEEVDDETTDKVWNLYFDNRVYIPVSIVDWKEIKKILNV